MTRLTLRRSAVWKKTAKWKKSSLGKTEPDAQLSQRDRAAGCVIVFAKSGRLELGDNISDIIGLPSTTVI